jgi:hypothetical protein
MKYVALRLKDYISDPSRYSYICTNGMWQYDYDPKFCLFESKEQAMKIIDFHWPHVYKSKCIKLLTESELIAYLL